METAPRLETQESRKLPIIACLNNEPVRLEEILKGSKGVDFVNMDMNPEEQEEGFVGEFRENLWAYIISPVDSRDKFSLKYAECTGVVVVGIDKETGNNISFLSHQNPNFFVMYKDLNFKEELIKKIKEIKDKCETDSIDAVVFGGKFASVTGFPKGHKIHDIDKNLYLESIKIISHTIDSVLDFKPTIISGPKFNPSHDHVVFINDKRRLQLVRLSNDPKFIKNFNPDDIDALSKDWEHGDWDLPKMKGE